MPSIYIAGKIRKGRHTFRPFDIGVEVKDYVNHPTIRMDDFFYYSGPFAIGCDHGCYHSEDSHGAGKNEGGCSNDGIHENTIHQTCLRQIETSDIFLAWIDSLDCFGTIAELGYAFNLAKKDNKLRVFIAFDASLSNIDIQHLWFVSKFGENLGKQPSLALALDKIENKIELKIPGVEDVPFTRFS